MHAWGWACALAAAYASRARAQPYACSYPGSASVSSYAPTSACTLDYSAYVRSPVPLNEIRAEYQRRCPSVINNGTTVHRVGGLGIRGAIAYYDQYRDTFETFLNERLACTKGLLFRTEDLSFDVQDSYTAAGTIDMVYSNPSSFSCFMASYGVRPMMSQVNYRTVSGRQYELEYFGGAMIVRADSNITSVSQIAGKRVSAVKMSGLGAMQLQWQHLQQQGTYLFDAATMVMFAQNQRRIVYDVLNGRADVGFVRTDQVEGMEGAALSDGTTFQPSSLRILEPIAAHAEYSGTGSSFPFASTTTLTPEWPLGMQASLDPDVAFDVMTALASIEPTDDAAIKGRYVRWRPALDYISLVRLNLNLGIMSLASGQCADASDLYSPVNCPPGHFKKPYDAVARNCQDLGLAGKADGDLNDCFDLFLDGDNPDLDAARARAVAAGYVADDSVIQEVRPYQCICDPCSPVPEQDIVARLAEVKRGGRTVQQHMVDAASTLTEFACQRLESCFTVVVADDITLMVEDVLGRSGRQALGLPLVTNVTFARLASDDTTLYEATPVLDAEGLVFQWRIQTTLRDVGSVLMQILADGENINASPFTITVLPAPASSSLPRWQIALIVIAGAVLVLSLLLALVRTMRHHTDTFTLEEHYARIAAQLLGDIEFVQVLGEGSFGRVYHAVWQGSHVAVKVIEHTSAAVVDMAAREARLTTELTHPNIVMTLHYAVRGEDGAKSQGTSVQQGLGSSHVGTLLRAMRDKMSAKEGSASIRGKSFQSRTSSRGVSFLGRGSRGTNASGDASVGRQGGSGRISCTSAVAHAAPGASQPGCGVAEGCETSSSERVLDDGVTHQQHAMFEGSLTQDSPVQQSQLDQSMGRSSRTVTIAADAEMPWDDGSRATLDKSTASDMDTWDSLESTATTPWESARPSQFEARSLEEGEEQSPTSLQTWIILEYCDKGSLSSMMRTKSFRTEHGPKMTVVLRTVLDVARGMQYLHDNDVVHSDLKTGNVLLQSRGDDPRGFRAKVADFGLSRSLNKNEHTIQTNTHGTITHMPPELLHSGRLTSAADVFSFGMLMWEVYTGSHPFEGASHAEVIAKLAVKGERPEWPSGCNTLYQKVAAQCWAQQVEDRPTFETICTQLDGLLGALQGA